MTRVALIISGSDSEDDAGILHKDTTWRSRDFDNAEFNEAEEFYRIAIPVPGVDPRKLEAEVSEHRMTVRALTARGNRESSFDFSHPISADRVSACLKAEVLEIIVPKIDTADAIAGNPEFNVNQAISLAVSDVAKTLREQSLAGWIVGGLVAAATWTLGGFTALIVSAVALAAINSIVLILADIKQGRFGATRTLSDLIQFPAFLCLIAIGRFADYG